MAAIHTLRLSPVSVSPSPLSRPRNFGSMLAPEAAACRGHKSAGSSCGSSFLQVPRGVVRSVGGNAFREVVGPTLLLVWERKGGLPISAKSGIENSSRAPALWGSRSKARRVRPCVVAASSNEGEEVKDASEAPSSVTEEAAKPAISKKRAQAEAEVQKGQRTALVTGAISVLLGVGYLVLIQLLDTRGVILVPPPPEAFNP